MLIAIIIVQFALPLTYLPVVFATGDCHLFGLALIYHISVESELGDPPLCIVKLFDKVLHLGLS